MLKGKKILLGVCGSIAAYKAALLVRLLVKQGASIKVIMTSDAEEFITPLTLATLSKNPVLTTFQKEQGEWNNHVELGLWADAFVVAPLTANTLAKFAKGLCDNLLTATYLSARCRIFLAPAMDLDMWAHPSTRSNVEELGSYGNTFIYPEFGELASGLIGDGRLAEPETIVAALEHYFAPSAVLKDKQILITAGPTFEAIDPVRFIGNHSSGKMGFALAEAAANRGAQVTLVTGPVSLQTTTSGIRRIDVQSAAEMFKACEAVYAKMDIAIMSAAVADYSPATVESKKIKKKDIGLSIDLVKTVDILQTLGQQKKKQLLIGFALETDNELRNAEEKLLRKNADMIVLNSLQDTGAGFKSDTNKVTLLTKHDAPKKLALLPKSKVAEEILNEIERLLTV